MRARFEKLIGKVRKLGFFGALTAAVVAARNLVRTSAVVRTRPHFATTSALLDFVFGADAASIRPSQVRWEIESLLELLQPMKARFVLEIGTNNGGSLFLWTRVAADDAEFISLDLPGGEFGGGYPAWRRPLYRSFALPQQKIHLLQADSHASASLEAVKALLGDRKLDFLLIDGDHTCEGVKRDFEMYSPLVHPGGLIAFHDIAEHADVACQVRQFWLELRQTRRTREFIVAPPVGWAGIGVVFQD